VADTWIAAKKCQGAADLLENLARKSAGQPSRRGSF
jgi:hypothetical protein